MAGPRPSSLLVGTSSGPVLGLAAKGVRAFLGLPYAAAPRGELRWRPPRPPLPWATPRPCRTPAPACPQPDFMGPPGPTSQDCLHLNIWAPESGKRLPVLVWLHGGGFIIGSGSLLFYDGTALASRGAVVVTLNYRLGPLGWLAHPDLADESGAVGNYGLLDQTAALAWLRRNISAFGGDSENITLFGQSAGAVSICRLLCSPRAKGLFHKAVCQSGGPTAFHRLLDAPLGDRPSAFELGRRLARSVGSGPDDTDSLRRAAPEDLLEAGKRHLPQAEGEFAGMIWGPVVGGAAQPEDPWLVFDEARQHAVPVLCGSTADEMTAFIPWMGLDSPEKFQAMVERHAGGHARRLLELFPCQWPHGLFQAQNALLTTRHFTAPARFLARAAQGHGAWLYRFGHRPDPAYTAAMYRCSRDQARLLGAAHSVEIPHVFGTLDLMPGVGPADRAISEMMMGYWLNFARHGDPNGPGLPPWPSHEAATDAHLELDAAPKTGHGLAAEACDIFEAVWRAKRGRP